MNRADYPDNWEEISKRIRFERAGNKCEQCGVPNNWYITRLRGGKWEPALHLVRPFWKHDEDNKRNGLPGDWSNPHAIVRRLKEDGTPVTYIVLTVAHIGALKDDGSPGDKHDKSDVRDVNLKALCQSCHLHLDLNDHITNRRYGRNWKRDQTKLPL